MKKKFISLVIVLTVLLGGVVNAQKSVTGLANGKKFPVVHKTFSVPHTQFTKAAILTENFETGALPTGWTTVIGQGSTDWTYITGGHSGNPASAHGGTYNAHFYVGSYAGDNATLITPALDLSTGTYKLSFWLANVSWAGDIDELHVSYKEGETGTWTSLLDITTDNSDWTEQAITIPSNNSEVYIGFNAVGLYGYGICIDDVSVFDVPANDLAVTAIAPTWVMSGGTVTPQVTVYNNSTADQATWTVTLIDGADTLSTKNGSTLTAGSTVVVDMDPWTPADGVHNLKAYVTLTGDANHANDTLLQDFTAVVASYTQGNLYGYNAFNDSIVDVNKTTGALTDIALATTGSFLSCGDYINGVVYGVEYGTNDLYLVNGDGGTYKVGTITGVNSITGIAYDAKNDVVYLADYVSGTGTKLYTLNMTTLVATYVGDITTNLIIGIAAGNNGELWGIDISTDHFWTIDPATGAGTDVGALGVYINYAQDMGYDRAACTLYGTLFTSEGGLYTINTTTGAATLVGTFTDEVTMCAIASTVATTVATDILTFDFNGLTPVVTGTVNSTDHTVALTVPYGTDVTALVPTITLSCGATVSPASGVAQDFTYSVTYTVTAGDGTTTQDWVVTVTVAPNTATDILTFDFNGLTPAVIGTVNSTNQTVALTVPYGTDVTALVPTITLSAGATVSPASGVAQNFTYSVTYTVTAEDGTTTQDWVVTVTVGPQSINTVKSNISFGPNPTSGMLRISADQNYNINVIDISGKIVATSVMNSNVATIDMTNMNSGIYFVRLSNEQGTQVVKVVKQ